MSNKLELKIKEDGTLGIYAKENLFKSEKIIVIPKNHILTSFDDYPRSYFFYEMGDNR